MLTQPNCACRQGIQQVSLLLPRSKRALSLYAIEPFQEIFIKKLKLATPALRIGQITLPLAGLGILSKKINVRPVDELVLRNAKPGQ